MTSTLIAMVCDADLCNQEAHVQEKRECEAMLERLDALQEKLEEEEAL